MRPYERAADGARDEVGAKRPLAGGCIWVCFTNMQSQADEERVERCPKDSSWRNRTYVLGYIIQALLHLPALALSPPTSLPSPPLGFILEHVSF